MNVKQAIIGDGGVWRSAKARKKKTLRNQKTLLIGSSKNILQLCFVSVLFLFFSSRKILDKKTQPSECVLNAQANRF